VPLPEQTGQNQNIGDHPADSQRLAQRVECRVDIEKHCKKIINQLGPNEVLSDMDALECLQDAGYSESEILQPACSQAVWDYKIDLTQV
jgi:hypothetical protein